MSNFEDFMIEDTVKKDKEIDRLRTLNGKLLQAAKAAKKYLEPDLVEPGRTVFWALVHAIAGANAEVEVCVLCGNFLDGKGYCVSCQAQASESPTNG